MSLPYQADFSGKVVVITGANGVICSTMVRAFAEAGAKVAALGRNEEALSALSSEVEGKGQICKWYKTNVLDRASLEEVRVKINEELGPCNILINGVGGNNPRATCDNEYAFEAAEIENCKTFESIESDDLNAVFSINFQGTVLPTQVFAKDLVETKGCILNITSLCAEAPLTKVVAYSGAKAAVSNFTQWLAVHYAMSGVRCNAIAPGFIISSQNRALLFDSNGNPSKRTKKIMESTPTHRFVEAEELLGATFFLCDENAASAVTGVVLPIDAGFLAYCGV